MTAFIDIPFAIGQTVWRASATPIERWVECPECVGTRATTMILGNGEERTLACACCGVGYEPPSGVVRDWDYDCEPEAFICRDLEVRDGEVRYGGTRAAVLYEDKEECRAHCAVLNKEHQRLKEERDIGKLSSRRRGMAWSVHYWSSQVRKLRKELALVEARLSVCKERKTGE